MKHFIFGRYIGLKANIGSIRMIGKTSSLCRRLLFISLLSIPGMNIALATSADGDGADAADNACSNTNLNGKVYVKGNGSSTTSGNGSINSPYNKLSSVPQNSTASTWKTLVVIPATSATATLVGTVTLKNCQNIVGTGPNPVKASAGTLLATIKGPANGDVVILQGNHKIKNLWIKDANRFAINMGSDTNHPLKDSGIINVALKKVLVTNSNYGDYNNLIDDHLPTTGVDRATIFGGIGGLTYRSGMLDIIGSRIDGGVYNGLLLVAAGTSNRTVHVKNSTIRNRTASANLPVGNNEYSGISTFTADTAHMFLDIDNANMDTLGNGISMSVLENSSNPAQNNSATVKNSSFSNLTNFGHPFLTFATSGTLQTFDFEDNDISNVKGALFIGAIGSPDKPTYTNIIVNNNSFSNMIQGDIALGWFHLDDFSGASLPGDMTYTVTNNTFNQIPTIAINSQGDAHGVIANNKFSDTNIGFENLGIIKGARFEKNCMLRGAIGLHFQNFFGAPVIFDAGGGPLGSVGLNSFVGLTTDIQQDGAPGDQVYAKKNYFDGGPVVINLGPPGFVNTSNALSYDPCSNSGCQRDGHHKDGFSHDNPNDWDYNDDNAGWNENSN